MTDRELLELAAKAAGYNMAKVLDGYPMYMENYGIWNPLTDDGDALRLAVKLELCFDMRGDVWVGQYPVEQGNNGVVEQKIDDHMKAVRRAIVRAAAEIGKAQSATRIGRHMQ